MASFEKVYYCKNCKKNVTLDKLGHCKNCGGNSFNISWSARFRTVINGEEIQKRLSGFKTKQEAIKAHANYIIHPIVNAPSHKYNDLLPQYLIASSLDNADGTVYDKKQLFAKYITPYFKNKTLENLTKAELQKWQNDLFSMTNPKTNKPYTHKYKKKIRDTFNNFLNWAEAIYDIPNLLKKIKTPKNKDLKKEINFWELNTFEKFIEVEDNIMWKTIWMTFMFTGARFNELRALSNDDLTDTIININKALNKTTFNKEKPIKPTKNYKVIKKEIPNILGKQVLEYKKWKNQNHISSTFLFGGEKPLSENSIRRRLNEIQKKAGVHHISPHGFRHSYVSLLINLGINTKIIAELIGDREEQVIKTYGHLYSDAKTNAIHKLNTHLNSLK